MSHADREHPGVRPIAHESQPRAVIMAVDLRVSTTGPVEGCRVDELVSRDGNRWSDAGEPTIYLGSSAGVAMAEFGRHLDEGMRDVGLWSLRLRASALVDLRESHGAAQENLLDRAWCSEAARRWRVSGEYEGLLVPSVAFLDRPECWNVVLFMEHLRNPAEQVLTDAQPTGTWRTVQ